MYRVYTERKWRDDKGITRQESSCKTFLVWSDIYFYARNVCYTNKKPGVIEVTAIKWFYTKYNNIWHFSSEKNWSEDGR